MGSLAAVRSQVEKRLPCALSVYKRTADATWPVGIASLEVNTGGIPQGALTQICTARGISSGKTTVLVSLLAQMTGREQFCALVDAGDGFDPGSAEAAGVDLSRVLWVRCRSRRMAAATGRRLKQPEERRGSMHELGRAIGQEEVTSEARVKHGLKPLEQAFKAADILVQNGGVGLIAVDLSGIEERQVRRVPLSTWFRFARVVEKMNTALVFLTPYPVAQSCAALTLHMSEAESCWAGWGEESHTQVLRQMECEAEAARTRLRKPVRSAQARFVTNPIWA